MCEKQTAARSVGNLKNWKTFSKRIFANAG